MTTAIAAADPAARIALRRHPAIMAVILSDLTIRALTIAIEIPVNRARERALALDRASALGRDLDLAGDRARVLEFDLRSRGRDHDHDVALGLAQHIDFARGYTSHIAEALASARGLAVPSTVPGDCPSAVPANPPSASPAASPTLFPRPWTLPATPGSASTSIATPSWTSGLAGALGRDSPLRAHHGPKLHPRSPPVRRPWR